LFSTAAGEDLNFARVQPCGPSGPLPRRSIGGRAHGIHLS
jgi:hypothetical protein